MIFGFLRIPYTSCFSRSFAFNLRQIFLWDENEEKILICLGYAIISGQARSGCILLLISTT